MWRLAWFAVGVLLGMVFGGVGVLCLIPVDRSDMDDCMEEHEHDKN